jgi:hydroxyethylthiazole kinase-like uncharacterized protein yjeF
MSTEHPDGAIDPASALVNLPRHDVGSHKYQRGHVLVVSAGLEATGAARLAARAALRIGAGLVTVASPPDALAVHAATLTAIMVRRYDDAGSLAEISVTRHCTAVVIGPGLPPDGGSRELVSAVIALPVAVVIDAGGLSAFESDPEQLLAALRRRSVPTVLTPHEGEFARVFPGLDGPRPSRAEAAARHSNAVMVLKGRGTVIASPDGRLAIDRLGPATLATAGGGDVLTGLVCGLLGQQMPAFEAACAAVSVHGLAALRFGPGLIAEDLEAQVPAVLASLDLTSR